MALLDDPEPRVLVFNLRRRAPLWQKCISNSVMSEMEQAMPGSLHLIEAISINEVRSKSRVRHCNNLSGWYLELVAGTGRSETVTQSPEFSLEMSKSRVYLLIDNDSGLAGQVLLYL